MRRQVERLLDPRALALVGATERPGYASRILRNLRSGTYSGQMHLVNPARSTVHGLATVPSVCAIDEPVDVAVLVVPPDAVACVLRECVMADIGVAVVITAGFSEGGDVGRERLLALRSAVDGSAITVIGPNSNGYASTASGLWASSFSGLRPAEAQPTLPIALLSQSGASAFGAAHERAQDLGFSFQTVIATGNEDLTSSTDLTRVLLAGDTHVVALISETLHDIPSLLRANADACRRGRSIVVLKVGRSAAGRAAAATHTAALASDDRVLDGVLAQHGIVRVDDIDDLVQTARYLALAPRPAGRRAVVLSHSGGLGAIAADALGSEGFELPRLSDRTAGRLTALLGGQFRGQNPVDITMALREPVVTDVVDILADEQPDLIQVVTAGDAALLGRVAAAATDVPRHLVWTSGLRRDDGPSSVDASLLAWFTSPTLAARSLARCRDAAALPARPAGSRVPTGAADLEVDEVDAKLAIEALGLIRTPARAIAGDIPTLVELAATVPRPWVLKITAPHIVHKTQGGFIELGITDVNQLKVAAELMVSRIRDSDRHEWRFLLEHQHRFDRELFIACTVDPDIGPVIGVGSGGTDVEIEPDITWGTCPLDEIAAQRLASRGRLGALADAGHLDTAVVAHALLTLSERFAVDASPFASIELNPVIVEPHTHQLMALDAVVRLCEQAARETPMSGGC